MARKKNGTGNQTVTEFMMGRYGYDELSKALIILGMIFLIITVLMQTVFIRMWGVSRYMYLIAIVILAFGYFRMLSKKIKKRKKENEKYLKFMAKFSKKAQAKLDREERVKKYATFEVSKELGEDGETVYACYRCRTCDEIIRFEEGSGVIKVVCPNCGNSLVDRA